MTLRTDDPETIDAAPPLRDSAVVAGWTAVARVSGLVRVVVIATVLGATHFGNLYLAANLLPNILFEFLTGPLIASLIVPSIVSHIDRRDRQAVTRIVSGFLSSVLIVFAMVAVVVIAAGPAVLGVLTLGVADASVVEDQASVGWLLLAMLVPQVLLYVVVGTAVAVQNAHGSFGLPSAAPLIENVGIVLTLVVYAVVYGTGTALADVGPGHILLLGGGTTAAVAVHAAVQWWGARRVGITLRPARPFSGPEVHALLKLVVPSMGYAMVNASRQFAALIVGSSVAGGVVAFQIAVNFYNLPVALAGRPVAQASLPRLSRAAAGDGSGTSAMVAGPRFEAALRSAFGLLAFVVAPAGLGLFLVSSQVAEVVSFGEMRLNGGVALLAAAILGLALGAIAESFFLLGTQAHYALRRPRAPLVSAVVRAGVSLAAMVLILQLDLDGPTRLLLFGLALAGGDWLAAVLTWSWLAFSSRIRPMRSADVLRCLIGLAALTGAVWVADQVVAEDLTLLAVSTVAGAVAYLVMQAATGSPIARQVIEARWPGRRQTPTAPPTAPPTGGAPEPSAAGPGRTPHLSTIALLVVAAPLGLLAALAPVAAVLGVAALVCGGLVIARPHLGAYLYLATAPLLTGFGRTVLNLRANELVLALLIAALSPHVLAAVIRREYPRQRIDGAVLGLCIAGFLLPVLWLLARGTVPSGDDLAYAIVFCKLAALYVVFRFGLRTWAHLRVALVVICVSGSVVGVIGIAQALGVENVVNLLNTYLPAENREQLTAGRASSTIASPIGFGAAMVIGGVCAAGWALISPRHRTTAWMASVVFAVAALSSGQVSIALTLVTAAVLVAVFAARTKQLVVLAVPVLAVVGIALQRVVAARLSALDSDTGLPASWTGDTGRIGNLTTHVLPQFQSGFNWLLGVRPAARIPAPETWRDFIYIESGFVWILWVGGIPLMIAFWVFVIAMCRTALAIRLSSVEVSRVLGFIGVVVAGVLVVLTIFDPHLTLRGSSDVLFPLAAALATAGELDAGRRE